MADPTGTATTLFERVLGFEVATGRFFLVQNEVDFALRLHHEIDESEWAEIVAAQPSSTRSPHPIVEPERRAYWEALFAWSSVDGARPSRLRHLLMRMTGWGTESCVARETNGTEVSSKRHDFHDGRCLRCGITEAPYR